MPSWFKKDKKVPAEEGPSKSKAELPKPVSPNSSKGVLVSRLLSPELILSLPESKNKAEVIGVLVRRLCGLKPLPDAEVLLKNVMEREQGISTTLDTGLSLPHARVDRISEISAILGLLPQGLPDPNQPEQTIRAMFLFFSPNIPTAFPQHLHLLRQVSALFQPELIEQLMSASPQAAIELIRARESS